ncbi:RASSF1 isoform 3 [Pongo abelii]|uniref:RASSF1 isoform 3 n=1 Tax=Pongo abelii TaxID=9601 RepID=A0A2J8TH04_PONAB|nr:RASSF1 isoform 3 [Pongo abelii]
MSGEPELIELRELAPAGRAGQGRTRLERANALRIARGTACNPTRQLVPGRGHRFQPAGPATHTWCDLCGDFIWGVVRKGLQCAQQGRFLHRLHQGSAEAGAPCLCALQQEATLLAGCPAGPRTGHKCQAPHFLLPAQGCCQAPACAVTHKGT